MIERSNYNFYFETNRVDGYNRYSYYFKEPLFVLCLDNPKDIIKFFANVEQLRKKYFLAGFLSYELGLLFEDRHSVPKGLTFPYALFAVYDRASIYDNVAKRFIVGDNVIQDATYKDYKINNFRSNITDDEYIKNVFRIKEAICSGEVYQVNYTSKYHFDFEGSPFALYSFLKSKQSVSYNVFAEFLDYCIISISPELFFSLNKNKIRMKPMKGTIKRGLSIKEDIELKRSLRYDAKNKSENIMIVDLLRNDLGAISLFSSVRAFNLFEIERYETLYQMTSTIESTVKSVSFYDIIKALFPSGSITGAPKIASMKFISELEKEERKIYTGAIGFLTPSGDASFNVAIRTLLIKNSSVGELGIGSGIVYDSEPIKERDECRLKALFVSDKFILQSSFSLIETIRFSNNDYEYLFEHLERLEYSARYFNFVYSQRELLNLLSLKKEEHEAQVNALYKVRLLLSKDGSIDITFTRQKSQFTYYRLAVSKTRVQSSNVFLFHKTTNRLMYDNALKKVRSKDYFDIIFFNEKDELTEGSISSIYLESKEGIIYTPSLDCGLLNGTMRNKLIKEGKVIEKVLNISDIRQATKVYISNSMIGFVKALIVE